MLYVYNCLMSLRHALMALLAATPMTGYTLAKQFDQSAAFVWHAPHSQIYPELRHLEEAGLIAGHEESRGVRGTKRTYAITDEGRAELQRWVAELSPPPRERDGAYLKATYFEFGSFANARRQFQAHLAHHRQQQRQWETHVEQLENRDTSLLRLRLAAWPEHLHDAIVAYKAHVYRGLASRARGEVEWARSGLDMVDRLEAAASAQEAGG
jgi:PadR family transcriptional regulator, regulatory protein AphA